MPSPARTTWTKQMVQRLQQLDREGKTVHEITDVLFEEFGGPVNFGETKTELAHLKKGPNNKIWNAAMEDRVKQLYDSGKDAKDITTELFHEFGRPNVWQETYRKVQAMNLEGEL